MRKVLQAIVKQKTPKQFERANKNGRNGAGLPLNVWEEISRAGGERDLDEIRQELVSAGYLKEKRNSKRQSPKISSDAVCLILGTEIL